MNSVAYLDESAWKRHFVLAAVVTRAGSRGARRAILGCRRRGQSRIHFAKESPQRRRAIVTALEDLPLEAVVVLVTDSRSQLDGRDRAMSVLVDALAIANVDEIVLDHVERGERQVDRPNLTRFRHATGGTYRYEQPRSAEPMIWIADALAWIANRGAPTLTLPPWAAMTHTTAR